MFAALPEEEKGTLRVTCFAPLLLIDLIATISMLVIEIFDRHLGDMKFQFRETIIQMKPIHVCLILGLRVSPIANEFLFVDPEYITNFRRRRFPKKKNTYGLKEIGDALKQAKLERYQEDILRLNLLKIILSFLLPNKGRNIWVKYVDLVDDLQRFNRFPWGEQVYNLLWWQIIEFAKYRSAADKKLDKALSIHGCTWVLMIWTFLSIPNLKFQRIKESIHLFPKLQGWRMTSFKRRQIRYQIEAPAIGAAPAIDAIPTIGNTPTIGVPAISVPAVVAPIIGSSSSAAEIGAVVVRVYSQLEKYGKMFHNHGKMLERILISTVGDSTLPLGNTPLLGQYQFSTPEKTVKHKREGGLIPKIPKKGLANRVSRKRRVQFPEHHNIQSTAKKLLQQVAPGEILEVANALMVNDDVEVGREENFNALSFEYGGELLKWKKGEEKDNDDKENVEEKVKSVEVEVQEMEESKNSDEKVDGDEKVDDVTEEEDSEQPTVVVYYTEKKDVQHDNEASADQITVVSVEEQTLEVEKIEDKASQTKESKEDVEQNKKEAFEG
ncbi:hypothetical protein GIB67_015303 [Kingdonia uniflora]|uniref:DUF1985 domain-containing protein n=1 Tax=Kingdonia uniflora TaxID=39325 RepID=A0A7J7KYK0_9MAGN|nr:hypothetical protein GIB67_015303 [Kingdonia uniflora]